MGAVIGIIFLAIIYPYVIEPIWEWIEDRRYAKGKTEMSLAGRIIWPIILLIMVWTAQAGISLAMAGPAPIDYFDHRYGIKLGAIIFSIAIIDTFWIRRKK